MGPKLRDSALDLLLLTGMLLSVMHSFVPVRWTWGLEVLAWTAMGGLLAGFLLAHSVFLPRLAHSFSLIYGMVGTALAVSQRLPEWLSLRLKVIEMALRIGRWLETAWRGQGQSSDTLIFVLELAFLSWWIGYLAAWFAFRRRQLWGILIPSGLLFFWNLYYSPTPLTSHLFVYLLCALLLVIHLTLQRRREHWRQEAIGFELDSGMDALRYGIFFALTIIALAWLIPPLTNPQSGTLIEWLPAERVGVRIQQEWQRLFAALEYPSRGPGEPFGMTLGWPGPISTDTEQVLTIQAPFRRYYWRAVVYDEYTGQEWRNTDTRLALLPTYTPLTPTQEYAMRQEVSQKITTHLPGTTILFGAPQPLHMSLPAKVYHSSMGEDPTPPSLWQSHRPLRPEESYMVVSSLSIASEEDLRQAGTNYPAWVWERYLQLPDELPSRVISLSYSIAGRAITPYDQVTALERYLRLIPYNDQVSPSPPGRDTVDYFLFDRREGYCVHYASALVVMARALGIPARLAAGYSIGEYDTEKGIFSVSRADGHAWAEVFFPEYGWIEFEPTATEPLIARPHPVVVEGAKDEGPESEAAEEQPSGPADLVEDEFPTSRPSSATPFQATRRTVAKVGGVAALLGILAVGGWGWSRWWIGCHFTPAAWAYARLTVFGRWLGCPLTEGQTPHQYAQELMRIVPEARTLIQHLVELYVAERFGHRRITDRAVKQTWQDLRPLLMRGWLRQRWTESPIRRLMKSWHRLSP